jgi:hypothetical protein
MKVKIGTLLDETLVQRAKKYAAEHNKALNQLIEQALEGYLQNEASDKVLSLEEILEAEPGSKSAEGSGRGAGNIGNQDFD